MTYQTKLPFPMPQINAPPINASYGDRLAEALRQNLDFHGHNTAYASHNFHSFPAKFPPQLPQLFIEWLTLPGDVVLDPMSGSGTTVLEASLAGRVGIGTDIDPLALRLGKTKISTVNFELATQWGTQVWQQAEHYLRHSARSITTEINNYFDEETKKFIDYWFLSTTQHELFSLAIEIARVPDQTIRNFLELVFSAIIITKSGGVSLARDLAHTRPHRVSGKKPRSALEQFQKRLKKNLRGLTQFPPSTGQAHLLASNAQITGLRNEIADLIVTSPPYAANAIDYMRAHKFSLVWFGYPIKTLSQIRRKYIGGEATNGIIFLPMPPHATTVIANIAHVDTKKAKVLHRYYTEMTFSLKEMYRLLKPGKAALVVVGTSTMRGIDTETHICLGEIAQTVGFDLIDIAVRHLDRDKRMMPARRNTIVSSQIEERMYQEYIIGLYKPPR